MIVNLKKPIIIENILHVIQQTIVDGKKFIKEYLFDKYDNSTLREYVMVLDIETTEMFKIKNENVRYIIQIAYDIYDCDLTLIKHCDYLINENVNKTDFFRRFTITDIRTKGLDAKTVLEYLNSDLKKCKYIVGHNIKGFDIAEIRKYMIKYKLEFIVPEVIDTMHGTGKILNLLDRRGYIKRPSLRELCNYLNINYDDNVAHNGSTDIYYTYEVFRRLLKNKLIEQNLINIDKIIISDDILNNNNYKLPNCSDEQNNILELLKNNNVIVDSVAGSGKTTSILHIAKSFNTQKILCLTYNSKLKLETREKAKLLNLTNIETHSYHSFCVKYYNNKTFNDTEIINVLNNKMKPKKVFNYDIIVLDEAQDITPIYYELICKIYADNKHAKLCIIGDRYQSIYDFNKADERFITFANNVFKLNNYDWKYANLTESFRVTTEIADFINVCVLNKNHIKSNKISNIKPRYLICDAFNTIKTTFNELKYYLNNGYKPSEIFILAPSIRNENSPARKLENMIKTQLKNIPVYVPGSDDEKLDMDILNNKLVFSSFHQSKGLERNVVIVFGFDNSYFKFYKKDKNPNICPNEIYVAITRASKYLSLIHHYENDYFSFIQKDHMKKYVNFVCDYGIYLTNHNKNNIDASVTDLIRHLPQDVINNCLQYIKCECVRQKNKFINIESKTDQKYGAENVNEITGTAIPAFYELTKKNKMSIYDILCESSDVQEQIIDDDIFIDSDKEDKQIKTYELANININNLKIDELLYICNTWCAYKSGYIFKLEQITNYNWLTQELLTECVNRLNTLNISNFADFEVKCAVSNKEELLNRRLKGYFDCIDHNNIYEFKCTNELSNEHILQLALYVYLHKMCISDMIGKFIKYKIRCTGIIMKKLNDNYYTILYEGKHFKMKLMGQRRMKSKVKFVKMITGKIIDYDNTYIYIINQQTNQKQIIKNKNIVSFENIDYNYYLYNILSDELLKISSTYDDIIKMTKYLFDYKYSTKKVKSNTDFLNDANIIMNKYI